ncbi:MAG TPA: GNAT family N-acetyltransferase [Steroidobacteraceae bacterium]|nr:GNAT family N-acetyltransferase [Steroidobacteraceae bacterium]
MLADPVTEHSPDKLVVEQWSELQFASARQEWESLLLKSDADPLFMSWDWNSLWWKHYRASLDASLVLLAARTCDGELVGIAPLYYHSVQHRGGYTAGRLEWLGNAWRKTHAGVFSEYLDLIIAPGRVDQVLSAFVAHLRSLGNWSDLIATNVRPTSAAVSLCRLLCSTGYVRTCDAREAHSISLPSEFTVYTAGLNSQIRRKVWAQRKRLTSPSLVVCDKDASECMQLIDRFHSNRWGALHFVGERGSFHRELTAALATRGALRGSILACAGEPISAMYNVRLHGAEYNLQSGFDGTRTSGISPAYLHFGYSIEQACRDGIKTFDFLAGEGKSRQYKRDFQTQKTDVVTIQAIRGPLAWLYRAYDRFRRNDPAESNSKEHD